MKNKTLLIVLLLGISIATEATIRTVSNNTASPGQYSSLQTAIAASAVGDTIYLQSSSTNYGDITINKRITIIGAGYAPDSTDLNVPSMVNKITFDSTATSVPTGSKFIGLGIYNYIDYATGDIGKILNITFERCAFHYNIYISGNSWSFLNCIFNSYSMDINSYSNLLITNSVFVGSQIFDSNKSSVSIYNSIFLNYSGTMFSSISYLVVHNCIFWNNTVSGCTNCDFKSSITIDEAVQALPAGNGNVSNSTDVVFVSNLPATTSTIPYADLKKYDWHLQATSPFYNAGTDGKQIGIYGGSLPHVNLSGMYPQIPVVKSFIIKNPVAQKDGKLSISVKAEKKQ